MPTTRRCFIKQSASAASAGLLLQNMGSATYNSQECNPPSSSALRPDPNILMVFSGLLVYQFVPGPPSVCVVSPLKNVSDHFYSVVLLVRSGYSTYPRWRHSGEPKNQLTLSVQGAREGVVKYTGRHPCTDPIDRRSDDNDCQDWRWTLNVREFLEVGELTPRFDLWPGIKILNGQFYTATKTSKARIRVTRKSNRREDDLYSVGSVGGANIYFDDNIPGALLDVGGSEPNVPMPNLENVRYELHVDYSPQSRDLPRATRNGRTTHFHRYNERMMRPRPRTMYDVKYYDVQSNDNKLAPQATLTGTPDVPCMGLEG